MIKIKGAPHNS